MISQSRERILSIAMASRMLGFVVYHNAIMDYGVKTIAETDKWLALSQFETLLEKYQPTHILLPDIQEKNCRLGENTKTAIKTIAQYTEGLGLEVTLISKMQIWDTFSLPKGSPKHVLTKHTARRFPELTLPIPPKRKLWEKDHPHQLIYTAANLIPVYEANRKLGYKFPER